VSSSTSSSEPEAGAARRFTVAFLAVFLLGSAGFVAGSEILIRRVVAPTDSFERYRAEFHATAAPVAAFGDSQVANAIISGGDVVNLGHPAETLPLMLFKAETYARTGKAKAIILQVAPQQFAIYRADNAQDGVREELLRDSAPLLQFLRPHFRRYLLAHWRAAIERWLAHETATATPRLPEPRTFAEWPAQEQRRSAEIRVQLHAPLSAGTTTEHLLGRLRAALDGLRASGIETCLVRYPLSDAYRKATSDVPAFSVLTGRVADLAQAQGARFIDLQSAVPDQMLVDPDHVGASGRAMVTQMVIDRCFGGAYRAL
jgi:hypothetical protein